MKKPTYTDVQIIQAGKQLLAEDKSVTPFAIRNLLGGGNHLRIKLVWEAAQHAGLPDTVGWDTQFSTISPKNRHIANLKKYGSLGFPVVMHKM
ncbi:MAG TPA: DNA-binding protein [Candidatus Thiothrix moscowensis]|uniref:DNA-binding protein n=2 Tax=Thiothrix TaxID=1030 RepID=UPI00261DD3D4|nr:DNA-binding protein [uncultured Thiothrix sp.]HRJ54626.1 DNA-binding protein [Candidatus Thiothrix moscowensis]HRJ95022.1 DNA-binding protein [Candidatus Thiothrix moscowensis]